MKEILNLLLLVFPLSGFFTFTQQQKKRDIPETVFSNSETKHYIETK